MPDLERYVLTIASRELGHPAPQSTANAVRESIESHHLWEANDWLIPLLQRLIDRIPTAQPVEIPCGYPAGSSGLSNLLADLEAETWLDVDDYGEGVLWRLPATGLEVFISRESWITDPNADTYEVRQVVA